MQVHKRKVLARFTSICGRKVGQTRRKNGRHKAALLNGPAPSLVAGSGTAQMTSQLADMTAAKLRRMPESRQQK